MFQYLDISKTHRITDTHTKKDQLRENWHIWGRYMFLKSSRHEEKNTLEINESQR